MKADELKHIAPKLNELKKLGSGFKVPNTYFESTEHVVFLKKHVDNLESDSPFEVPKNYFKTVEDKVIHTIKYNNQKNVFSIPENYFETLEDSVFEKVKREPKTIRLKNRFVKTFIQLAAASLLLFITFQLFNDPSSTDLLVNLEISEIESWIDNGDLELDSYEIAAIYENVDFDELEINQQYNNEYLIEYLEDIDIESLYLNN